MSHLSLLIRAWLGSLFLYSGSLKLIHYDRAAQSVKRYEILPARLSTMVGFMLPWGELLTSVSLLFGWHYRVGALMAALFGSAFTFSTRKVLQRHADVPCGCTGKGDDRVTRTTLIRGIAITISSLWIVTTGRRISAKMPPLLVLVGMCVSLLSAAIDLHHKIRQFQHTKQRAHLRTQRIAQLTTVLSSQPAPPLSPTEHDWLLNRYSPVQPCEPTPIT